MNAVLRLIHDASPRLHGEAPLVTKLHDAMPNLAYVVNQITYLFRQAVGDHTLSGRTKEAWDAYVGNVERLSSGLPATRFNAGQRIHPLDYVGTPANLVSSYLRRTPLAGIFRREVPFNLPDERRFEHEWVVAASGQGKSTLLESQIAHDFKRVARGECSVVVIDSQNRLFTRLRQLKLFAPGQPLDGRLTVIEPDPDNYLPLNPFGIGRERLATYTARDREQLTNAAISLMSYVFTDLSEAGITSKQEGVFTYCCKLVMAMPNGTITDLIQLLKTGIDGPGNYRQYLPLLDQLEPDGSIDSFERDFFETSFTNDKEYRDTRSQVLRRVELMLSNRNLRRMFMDSRPSYDMFTDLSNARVVLINTDKDLLKEEPSEIFGRLFIALVLRAAQERATIGTNLPTFVYVDEAHEYIARDEKINQMLVEARKQKVGLILAHVKLADIKSGTVQAALSDVSCRFAGGNESDGAALARILHVLGGDEAHMSRIPQGQFACWVRHVTDYAITVRVPKVILDSMPKMRDDELEAVRQAQRDRFKQPANSPRAKNRPPPPDEKPDEGTTSASDSF